MSLENKKVLVAGASSDLATVLNKELHKSNAILGFHYCDHAEALAAYSIGNRLNKFRRKLDNANDCHALVEEFVKWAGGIDVLIQLVGNIHRAVHWQELNDEDWNCDLHINLKAPFFLAQKASVYMKNNGGRIIFVSTASASHGGGVNSLAYGTAKAGIECLVKGLARHCAQYKILVNAVAPGFIPTKFQTERMKMTPDQLLQRAQLTPLKRGGTKEEFSGTVMFLLSDAAAYITGQIIALSGGDWL